MNTRVTSITLFLLVVAVCSGPIFIDLGRLSVELWDESLNAVNALEMSRDGDFIVRHYGGAPDMWNTKPPLAVWLQVLSMKAFGYSEFAFRLPSALFALCTIVLVVLFSHAELRNPVIGYFSALVLVTSRGYVAKHVSRTGDNDVFLVFFLVASVLFFYRYVEHEKGKRVNLLFAALSLTCAALTKGVACLVFLPGMLAYVIFRGKLKEIVTSPAVYLAILSFLTIVAGYYLLREHYNPGYLRAVWTNEVAARYIETPQFEHHPGGLRYYATELATRQFSSWLLFVPLGCALIFLNAASPMKRLAALLLSCAGCTFVIISLTKTKMQWYAAPLLPLLSMIVGAGLSDLYAHIGKALAVRSTSVRLVLGACFVAAVFLPPYARTVSSIRRETGDASALYGDYMKKIARSADRPAAFAVLHQGMGPHIYYYARRLGITDGIAIERIFSPTQLDAGEVVMTCQSGNVEWIGEHFDYEVLDTGRGCSMLRIRGAEPEGRSTATPPMQNTVADAVESDAALSVLASLLHITDLAIMLREPGPFTLFAPTDRAFRELPERDRRELFSRMPAINQTLLSHIAPGALSSADLASRPAVSTLLGTLVPLYSSGAEIGIGRARIIEANVRCSNGVLHVIDAVNELSPSPGRP
jgi:4-amino-4-deoxy-L-arabinose transferase-like glycosyltransferase/uncharacterized surface protein with fasciclin (FAS1) repeats